MSWQMSPKMFRTISLLVLLTAGIVFILIFVARHEQLVSQTKPATPAPVQNTAANTATPSAPLPPGTIAYTPKANTSALAIARFYLTESSFMTATEFEAAIRKANDGKAAFRKDDRVLVPGIEPQPVVEKSRPFPKDGEVRAIYLTGSSAGSARGIELVRRWHQSGGNAVVFDIKDSDGTINVPFNHPLARKLKSYPISNLPKYVRFLHSLDMHVIARQALFRDDNIARNHGALAVQSRKLHQPWRENGKLVWSDPSNPDVQAYNLALAKYVAQSGVDEVQFDYVRFPAEGDQADAQFAYQSNPKVHRDDVIASFLDKAYSELHPSGVLLSLDVFGVMAWQRQVDLNHTGQSMDRFQKVTAGTGVTLRPWLQAFAWKTRTYSPQYILTQVGASTGHGGNGFLFWNAGNDYSKPFVAMPVIMANPKTYLHTPAIAAPKSVPASGGASTTGVKTRQAASAPNISTHL